MKRHKRNEQNYMDNIDLSGLDINELLDKLLILQNGNKKTSFLKGTVYVVTGICVVMFVGLICFSVYKNSMTTESILSILLAFFSIFISIFFYFKADETSTKFYDSSYKFMKDISVTLGKIEERFGEKLNNLNEKLTHVESVSRETSREIEDKQEDKDKVKDTIINELMEKANLGEEERIKYRKEIEEKEKEILELKELRYKAENEADLLRHKIDKINTENYRTVHKFSRRLLFELLSAEKMPDDLSNRTRILLKREGYIDAEGNINKELILNELKENKLI